MKNIFKISSLILLTLCFSCEKSGFFVKCEECFGDEPTEATVKIEFDDYYGSPKINIYEGKLEDSLLIGSVTSSGNNTTFPVTLNKQYTITATYETGSKTFIAVDSVFPRVRYDEDQCENPCYYIFDRNVNLKIKYMN